MTVVSSTKSEITFQAIAFTASSTNNGVLQGEFNVQSEELIRTAGFTLLDTTGSYIEEYYSGVVTLGSLVDTVDQPYYFQEPTLTAATFNTKYTGPANQPVSIRKFASTESAANGGNGYSDMSIHPRDSVVFTTGDMSFLVDNATYGNKSTITSTQSGEFDGVSANDVIYVGTYTGEDAGNNANTGYYVVSAVKSTGTILVLEDALTIDENGTGNTGVDVDISAMDYILTSRSYKDSATITTSSIAFSNVNQSDWDALVIGAGDNVAVRGTGIAAGNEINFQVDGAAVSGTLTEGVFATITLNVTAAVAGDTNNLSDAFASAEGPIADTVIYKSDEWGHPFNTTTDVSHFVIDDLVTLTGATVGTTDGSYRVSANDTLSLSSSVIAFPQGSFGVEASNEEFGASRNLDADYRTSFKIFVRERGKSYAESALSDIGVATMTTIVYRFPITNTNDINIFTDVDTEIDNDQLVPASEAAVSGTNFSTIQINYLRNPQSGRDNLNIYGAWEPAVEYNAGDVVQETSHITEETDANSILWNTATRNRWYYCSNQGAQNALVGTEAGISAESGSRVLSNATYSLGSGFTFSKVGGVLSGSVGGGRAVIVDTTDATNFDTNLNVGDTIVVSNSDTFAPATNTGVTTWDGDNFLIHSFANEGAGTNNVIVLANPGDTVNSVVRNDCDTWGSDYPGDDIQEGAGGVTVALAPLWKNWTPFVLTGVNAAEVDPLEYPTRGGYVSRDLALQGGERIISGTPYPFDVVIDANDTEEIETTPYVDQTAGKNSTTGVYEFSQWALRLESYLNESASAQPQFQRTGKISGLLVDFVGSTLVTRDGVFIDDIDIDDQNAVQFTDFNGNGNLTYPRVVQVVINFNENLQNDADAVFYLYYTTLTGVNDDFGEINAVQVVESDLSTIVGTRAGNENKVNGNGSYSFQYAYDDDNAGGGKSTGTPFNVTAVAIGLGSGVYVTSAADIGETGAIITLVSPVERNYINP